jgi:carbohydrate-selective porin OprB
LKIPFGELSPGQVPQAVAGLLGGSTAGLPVNYRKDSWFLIANASQYFFVFEDPASIEPKIKSGQPLSGIGVFGRLGYAPPNTNPVTRDFSLALVARGVVASRNYDSFGVGFFYNAISNRLKSNIELLTDGARTVKDEKGIEIFYDFAISPAIRLIPGYQHIWNPLSAQVVNRPWADIFLLRLTLAL